MKANEFFKAMGLRAVKQFLENDNIRTREMHESLKLLVASHELVESIGGLDFAKKYIEQTGSKLDGALIEQLFIVKVRAAILDVESCQ